MLHNLRIVELNVDITTLGHDKSRGVTTAPGFVVRVLYENGDYKAEWFPGIITASMEVELLWQHSTNCGKGEKPVSMAMAKSLQTQLLVVEDIHAKIAEIRSMPIDQYWQAKLWAIVTHLRANDNDGLPEVCKPACLMPFRVGPIVKVTKVSTGKKPAKKLSGMQAKKLLAELEKKS
jgi:hypothetical protein